MYTKAFSKSLIHTQLLSWVSNQSGMGEDANKPKFSTPAAFIGEYSSGIWPPSNVFCHKGFGFFYHLPCQDDKRPERIFFSDELLFTVRWFVMAQT